MEYVCLVAVALTIEVLVLVSLSCVVPYNTTKVSGPMALKGSVNIHWMVAPVGVVDVTITDSGWRGEPSSTVIQNTYKDILILDKFLPPTTR